MATLVPSGDDSELVLKQDRYKEELKQQVGTVWMLNHNMFADIYISTLQSDRRKQEEEAGGERTNEGQGGRIREESGGPKG